MPAQATRYSPLAQTFHWVIAGLIIVQFTLARLAEPLPLGVHKLAILARHKSVGMTILMLAVLRLFLARRFVDFPVVVEEAQRLLALTEAADAAHLGPNEDLRAAAKMVEGKTVNGNLTAMIVPGSGIVKEQAEAEGLDKIFIKAGFEWREPGCSMCLAMNPDKLLPEERCASTSNRNFEGRQGFKGRTHLVSPAMAAAAAIAGHFVDIREWW